MSNPLIPKCKMLIYSDATKKRRQCRNYGVYDGYCSLHALDKEPDDSCDELQLALRVIEAVRKYLRDPEARDYLIRTLRSYEARMR